MFFLLQKRIYIGYINNIPKSKDYFFFRFKFVSLQKFRVQKKYKN